MNSALAPTYARYDVEFVSGSGCVLVDSEGVEYLDFLSGIAVNNLGHCHPAVVSAVQEQVGRLIHISNLFYNEPNVRLAARLVERSLGGVVFFCNSGAEANEAAIKLVRKARPRGDVIVAHQAFHGRTYGALSATPQEAKQAPFAPLVPGFRALPARDIPDAVDEHTAAVLIEPVQGESGVNLMAPELLSAIRAACDAAGAALVFDEVQTGMGRTGSLWAYEQVGVVPDAMTLAKGLGGGLPIGALVIGRAPEGRLRPRRPRLDVRRRAGGQRRGQRGARRDRRRGLPARRARAGRAAARGPGRASRRGLRARPRADGRRRDLRRRARHRAPRAARSST